VFRPQQNRLCHKHSTGVERVEFAWIESEIQVEVVKREAKGRVGKFKLRNEHDIVGTNNIKTTTQLKKKIFDSTEHI